MKKLAGMLGVAIATAGLCGCSEVQPSPRLPSTAFVANKASIGQEAGQGIDHAGPLIYDTTNRPTHEAAGGEHISETVREAIKSPASEAMREANATTNPANAPATEPATQPVAGQGVPVGQFQWVGSVIAKVDDQPIYADKVLTTLDRALAAEARAGTEEHFRTVAEDLIGKQIQEFIHNELEYAAAKKAMTDKKDEQIAKFLTSEWRKEQVRKAGGSEALARQRAAEDGFDFEELVKQQYRINMTRLYYQTKIFPLIQVRAQDMRQYYQANFREFQKSAGVKFRVLWIGEEASGGRQAAYDKAEEVSKRARDGEDFAELASKFNDDPGLMKSKGVVGTASGWMEKGEFAADAVENAVWDLKPGQVTQPIPANDGRKPGFWVAKLDDIRVGKTEAFENELVQESIRQTLHREQFAKLREIHQQALLRQAVVLENPNARQVMMEMVMQRYRTWVASR